MNYSTQSLLVSHENSYRPGIVESFRSLFYFLGPSDTRFKDISKVPNYTDAALPCFVSLIVIELLIGLWKGRRILRGNDALGNLSAGVISRITRVLTKRSIEITLYIYVYDHWRLADLEWNSNLTWFIAFVGMDFLYYWFHRAAHEINIFWASHQTHHSSEDYNLTTALRQSTIQQYCSLWFYLPNALLVPPSVHLVHNQLNILYQFWIHTELIDNLGPFEYILNTPSHHRVHHGRNPYCIDKNYAGTLIIWDRIFGTFAAEERNEKIAYGLVHNINTFNPIYIQLAAYRDLLVRAWKIDGLWNKVCVLVKGPGWSPGKPRLGNPSELPQVENPIQRYNPKIDNWVLIYGFIHYFSLVPIYDKMLALRHSIPSQMVVFDVLFFLGSLACISTLFDKKPFAEKFEFVRCVASAVIMHGLKEQVEELHELPTYFGDYLEVLYIISAVLWVIKMFATNTKKEL